MTKNFFPYRKTQKERIKEKFERVWRNSLPKQLKVKYFAAAVEADSGQYHNILGYSIDYNARRSLIEQQIPRCT